MCLNALSLISFGKLLALENIVKLTSFILIAVLSFSLQAQEACHQLFGLESAQLSQPLPSSHRFILPKKERLNLKAFFKQLEDMKKQNLPGVVFETAGLVNGEPVIMATLKPAKNIHPKKLLITGGVHGSEVMGVKNAVYLFEQLISNTNLREKFETTFVFNINNYGLKEGMRVAENDVDLNRHWSDQTNHPTTQTILNALNKKFVTESGQVDMDLFIDLHDAYSRDKYFIIKTDPQDQLLEKAVALLPSNIFIESKTGTYPEKFSSAFKVNAYELLAPGVTTSANEGTFKTYWYHKGVKNAYTFESPGQIDRKLNVETSAKILITLLEQFN